MTSSDEITRGSADESGPWPARGPAAADAVPPRNSPFGGSGSGARVTPPPLPGCAPANFAAQSDSQREFAAEYRSLDGPAGAPAVVEGLLKHPARVAFEVCDGSRRLQVGLRVAGVMTVGFVVYGALMGLFGGGVQLWRVPLKVMGGLWASVLLCLPSFYVFACLGGINLGVTRMAALLLEALAVAALLLLGFLPVAWIFSQSTNSVICMGVLHLTFVLCAVLLGLRLLHRALGHFHRRTAGWTRLWTVIFLLVLLQMATVLRPLVGPDSGRDLLPGKMLFLEHWFQTATPGPVL